VTGRRSEWRAWLELSTMLIAIEGCLGAGKSTVAKGLAAVRGSSLLLEDFEANPFLRAFYDDPIGNAIETEFGFLMLHFHQLKKASEAIAVGEVISDFHLGKDVLYAELNLPDVRLKQSFRELYELCSERSPKPNLLVYLSASTDLIVERIRTRRRDFELTIDPQYYGTVNAAYEELFQRYAGHKLRVDMNRWDFVSEPTLYERLNALVDASISTHGRAR
jgi:deoxyguanosine kinase